MNTTGTLTGTVRPCRFKGPAIPAASGTLAMTGSHLARTALSARTTVQPPFMVRRNGSSCLALAGISLPASARQERPCT